MKNEPIFQWDEEIGLASCILSDNEKTFVGIAQCHPDDADMKSQKTGCEIAFKRAQIKVLKAYKDELKIKLSALHQFYYSINQSKKFNKNSYENKMLKRQIHIIKFDLDTIKQTIADEEKNLKNYLIKKENFYKKIRNKRKNNEGDHKCQNLLEE